MVRWLRKLHLKWGLKRAKNVKNCLFKMYFVTSSKNVRQNTKPILERFFFVVFENGIKKHSTWAGDLENCNWSEALKGEKIAKSAFSKKHFLTTWPLGGSKKWYHVKFNSKISYSGKKISTLPWQMAEQLAVEVDVKTAWI